MKQKNLIYLVFLFFCVLAGCESDKSHIDRKNPMETGRGFVESLLKGDFKTAKTLLLPGKENETTIAIFQTNYVKVSPKLKSEEAIRSWKMEKWEEKDDNIIHFMISHEMYPQPILMSLKKIDGIWFVNFVSSP